MVLWLLGLLCGTVLTTRAQPGLISQGGMLQGGGSQGGMLKGGSQGGMLQTGMLPGGMLQGGRLQGGALQGGRSQSGMLQGSGSQGGMLKGGSQGGMLQTGMLPGGMLQGGRLQGGALQGGRSQSGMLQGSGSQGGMLQRGMLTGGILQGGRSQGGVLQGGRPQGGLSQGGMLQGGRPRITSQGGSSRSLSGMTAAMYALLKANNRLPNRPSTGTFATRATNIPGAASAQMRSSMVGQPRNKVVPMGAGVNMNANNKSFLRAMYAQQLDSQDFATLTAMTKPRLARTAIMDHRLNVNGLPSYRYAMSLDPSQPQYKKARQYVKLTGMMDSRGTDLGMKVIFTRLLQSRDPTIQRLLFIDAADGAYGDVAKRFALTPGGLQMMKRLGPMAMKVMS